MARGEAKESEVGAEQSVVASNSIFYFFRYLSKSFIAFIVSIFLVRFLGPTNYGIYTIVTIYWGVFLSLVTLGLGNAVQYGISKYRAENKFGPLQWLVKHYLKILVISSIIGSIAMYAVSGLIASVYRTPEMAHLIQILAIGLVFYAMTDSFTTNVYIGYQKIKYSFIGGVIFDVLRLLQGTIVIIGFGLLGVIAFYDVIYFIVALVSLYFVYKLLRQHKRQREVRAPNKDMAEFQKYNWFSYGSNLISYFYGSAISLILGIFAANLSAVSFFTVGFQLAALISLPAGSIAAAFFATNTKYFKRGQFKTLYRFLHLVIRYISMMVIPLAVGGITAAGPLIIYFYRSALLNAQFPLIIVIIANLIAAIFLPLTNVLSAIGKQKYFMYSTIVGAVVGLLSTLVLTPLFAENGAAVVILLTTLAILITNLYFTARYIKITLPYKIISKILLASLLMGGLIYVLDSLISLAFLPLTLLSSVVVYVSIIYLMGVLTNSDIAFFLKLTKLDRLFSRKTTR